MGSSSTEAMGKRVRRSSNSNQWPRRGDGTAVRKSTEEVWLLVEQELVRETNGGGFEHLFLLLTLSESEKWRKSDENRKQG